MDIRYSYFYKTLNFDSNSTFKTTYYIYMDWWNFRNKLSNVIDFIYSYKLLCIMKIVKRNLTSKKKNPKIKKDR